MTWAQFAEKEYETAAAVELGSGLGGGPVFSSGQVLEKLLGYDAASSPGRDHPIWRLLSVPRPPGVVLHAGHWQPAATDAQAALPRHPVSLILQFKRPEYLVGGTAAQWWFWRRPYLRFTTEAKQQRVLTGLEKGLGPQAAVRYASPAFWRRGEYEAAVLRREVLKASGFVSPASLAGHRVWSYIEPGRDGRANPGGKRAEFERLEDIFGGFRDLGGITDIVPTAGVATHLALLGEVARDRQPKLRGELSQFSAGLERHDLGLNDSEIRSVLDIAAITSLVHRQGAVWYLLGVPIF